MTAVERRLREWGATRINTRRTGNHASIDFNTPLPGDQPIRSGIQLEDGMVTEATIRYGVLNEDYFPTHPTNDNGALQRLRNVVQGNDVPSGALVVVNYGDDHRRPRPHLLYGWSPEGGTIEVSDLEYLQRGDPNEPAAPGPFMDWVQRVGRDIRREFRGEWAKEESQQEESTVGLDALAPDSVTGGED